MAGFDEEEAPQAPITKIVLGKKKPKTKLAGEKRIPTARPMGASTTVTTAEGYVFDASDVLVTRVTAPKGKEKASEKEAEETGALKRRRNQRSPSPPVGAIKGDSSILTRIGNAGLVKEDMTQLTPTQVAEKIDHRLAEISRATQLLQRRALLANEADALKKVADRRLEEAKDLQAELRKAKEELKKAKEDWDFSEKVAQQAVGEAAELISRLNNTGELAQFLFRDIESGTQFLREELVWTFGRWAFKSGQRRLRERTQKNMEQALEGDDLQLVLTTLPAEISDPGLAPFCREDEVAERSSAAKK
ncbi:PREDICTED: uncharacterized protein LOC109166139 [Ipomoea nil]|uniref:uncharacterized protein LOC109166139 n=1 Tax=Ipomoea nil TaxID=35883 RepID=UPI000901F36C|nr:PREDICTED: uncharacterized protein LOC109166139 [Ipomoea nil]